MGWKRIRSTNSTHGTLHVKPTWWRRNVLLMAVFTGQTTRMTSVPVKLIEGVLGGETAIVDMRATLPRAQRSSLSDATLEIGLGAGDYEGKVTFLWPRWGPDAMSALLIVPVAELADAVGIQLPT